MHPWDRLGVEHVWQPRRLRCLVVGENPGDVKSAYFYEVPGSYATDPIVVRRCLLRGLQSQKLLATATLQGFRDAGFLFDHAIRCPLPAEDVEKERNKARRYTVTRVQCPAHLRASLSQAPIVWVMGHLANNAVVNLVAKEFPNLIKEFPKEKRKISWHPFPDEAAPGSRFFVSEYFTWRNEKDSARICEAFSQFARARGVF